MTRAFSRDHPAVGNVAATIDAHRWSRYQIFVLLLSSLAILLDGFDNQALGFALPLILGDWHVPKAALGAALAASQFGMLFGTLLGGMISDRMGRKPALVASVTIFGAATLCIAATTTPLALGTLRLVAGLGLGAAFPSVAALAAEFTPARHRGLAVTIGIVSVPLGGTLGGLFAARILPAFGWPALFVVAGLVSLLLAVLLLALLPESVAFLAGRPRPDLVRIARTCRHMGVAFPLPASSAIAADAARAHGPAALLAPGYRRDTLCLWTAFFFCLASIYIAFGWLPTLLVSAGLDVATASTGLAAFNMGGVVAALALGWIMGRLGSRVPMVVLSVVASLSALAALAVPIDPAGSHAWLLLALGVEGACVNGIQTTLYALAALVYPVGNRASGVGAASGIGRLGAISSLTMGAVMVASGPAAFHGLIAASMAVVTVALLLVTRHQPRRGAARA